jgi:hypothetical protein
MRIEAENTLRPVPYQAEMNSGSVRKNKGGPKESRKRKAHLTHNEAQTGDDTPTHAVVVSIVMLEKWA